MSVVPFGGLSEHLGCDRVAVEGARHAGVHPDVNEFVDELLGGHTVTKGDPQLAAWRFAHAQDGSGGDRYQRASSRIEELASRPRVRKRVFGEDPLEVARLRRFAGRVLQERSQSEPQEVLSVLSACSSVESEGGLVAVMNVTLAWPRLDRRV